ncbi:MAG: Trk system potassium transporter TrkA [Fretibacterium sp.]|nr:Trk system potassium transporter TrkA [Fretibacterium sp.]
MNIVIVGAGEVGCAVAQTLAAEGHDVNLVEQDAERAEKLASELNVRVIPGNGARPQVLYDAGVREGCVVDLLLACTDRDEANMLSCWIARHAGVRRVISRVRSLEFTDSLTWARELGIDMMLSPERSVAREILELLSVSSAVHTAELLEGRAAIYAFHVGDTSSLAGKSLKDIRLAHPDLTALVVYVERSPEENIIPNGDTVLEKEDLCYVVSKRDQVWKLEKLFQGRNPRPLRKVFVVGGGKLGYQVTQRLQRDYRNIKIRLIDKDPQQCAKLAQELGGALILNGDGADPSLLAEEGIEDADGYVCATESDEVNLIYAALAKSMGVNKSIAVVRRRLYQNMPELMPVDAVVDPNEALASVILRYIRYPGHARALSIIEQIDAEMLELAMPEGSELIDIPLAQLKLPKGVLVALVGRGENVFVPTGATRLRAGDHMILFATTALMQEVVRLFEGERA